MKTKTKIMLVTITTVLVLCLCVGVARLYRTVELKRAGMEKPVSGTTVVLKHYRGRDYHVAKEEYPGEYDIQTVNYDWHHTTNPDGTEEYFAQKMIYIEVPYLQLDGTVLYDRQLEADLDGKKYSRQDLDEIEGLRVMDYEEYAAFCEEWQLTQEYTDPDLNYIVRSFYTDEYYYVQEFYGVTYEGSTAKLYIHDESTPSVADSACQIYTVPTDQDVEDVKVVYVYSEEEYDNILEFGKSYDPFNLF